MDYHEEKSVEEEVDDLLTSVHILGGDANLEEVKKVASEVLKIGIRQTSTAGAVLLSHLDRLLQPAPFLELIPSFFGMASPHQLQEVFETLKSIDNQFIGSVISALVDLPLTAEMKLELVSLIETAISTVDEKDIPFLFQTLLNNLEHIDTSNIPGKILKELSTLSFTTVSLVVETLWEVLPASPAAAVSFSRHIREAAQRGEQPSLMDLATTLIILSSNGDAHGLTGKTVSKRSILSIWLHTPEMFPFQHMETIISRRKDNEIWSRMLPSIWDSCLWILKFAVTDCHILREGAMWCDIQGKGEKRSCGDGDDALSTLQWRAPHISPCFPLSSSSSSFSSSSSSFPPTPRLTQMECCLRAVSPPISPAARLFARILSLFSTIYQHGIEYREGVIQALVYRCFYTTTQRYNNDIFSECYGSVTSAQQQFLAKAENRIRFERDLRAHNGDKDREKARSGKRKRFLASRTQWEGQQRFLPSVSECLSTELTPSSSSSSASLVAHQHGVSHVSMCVLEHLVCAYPETHTVLLTALMDKLHTASSSFSLQDISLSSSSSSLSFFPPSSLTSSVRTRQAYDSTLIVLPSALILHRLISSITQASRALQSSENTLLIVIQKLIGGAAHVDPYLSNVLCTPAGLGEEGGSGPVERNPPPVKHTHSNCSIVHINASTRRGYHHGYSSGTGASEGSEKRNLPPCRPVYHYASSCIGVLLASYMLRHNLLVARQAGTGMTHQDQRQHFLLQDVGALLTWIEKLLEKCKDLSVAYVLDILSVVATDIQQTFVRIRREDRMHAKLVQTLNACLQKVEKAYVLFRNILPSPCSGKCSSNEKLAKRDVVLVVSDVIPLVNFSSQHVHVSKNWQVSQVAKNLMTVAVPLPTRGSQQQHEQRMPSKGLCDKSLTNCVASLCWVFQKAAMLDSTLASLSPPPASSLSASAGGSGGIDGDCLNMAMSYSSSSLLFAPEESAAASRERRSLPKAFALSLTASNSDLALYSTPSFSPPPEQAHLTKNVVRMQYWLSDSCSEYRPMEKWRVEPISTYENVMQNLRMAWESALAGSVFSGHLMSLLNRAPSPEDHTHASPHPYNSAAAIALLHHLLGAFVRTRYFLRLAVPTLLSSNEKTRRQKIKEETAHKKKKVEHDGFGDDAAEVGGGGGRRQQQKGAKRRTAEISALEEEVYSEISNERNEVFFLHTYFIRRSIDRMSLIIPINILMHALGQQYCCQEVRPEARVALLHCQVAGWLDRGVLAQQLDAEEIISPSPPATNAGSDADTGDTDPLATPSSLPPLLFTNMGLQIALVICGKFLTLGRLLSSHTKQLLVDPFLTFDEVNINRGPAESTHSSSIANSSYNISSSFSSSSAGQQQRFKETSQTSLQDHQTTDRDSDRDSLYDGICYLFAYLPVLIRRAQLLRVLEADLVEATKEAVRCDPDTGGMLGACGHSLLLSVLYMTLTTYILHLQEVSVAVREGAPPSDKEQAPLFLQDIAQDKHMTNMLALMTIFALGTQKNSPANHFKCLSGQEEGRVASYSSCEKLMLLCRIMESHALSTPDITVSLTATKCFMTMGGEGRGSRSHPCSFLLKTRASALTWTLLKSIHVYSQKSIFPPRTSSPLTANRNSNLGNSSVEVNGTGLLSPLLHDFIAGLQREDPLEHFMATSSPLESGHTHLLLQQMCSKCYNLQLSAQSMAIKLVVKATTGLYQAAEKEAFAGFCHLFALWWSIDQSGDTSTDTDANNCGASAAYSARRIYGIFLLLAEVFAQCDSEYVHQQSGKPSGTPNDTTTQHSPPSPPSPLPTPHLTRRASSFEDTTTHTCSLTSTTTNPAFSKSNLGVEAAPNEHLPEPQSFVSPSTSVSMHRNSRARKAVQRFEPENYLKDRGGELVDDAFGDKLLGYSSSSMPKKKSKPTLITLSEQQVQSSRRSPLKSEVVPFPPPPHPPHPPPAAASVEAERVRVYSRLRWSTIILRHASSISSNAPDKRIRRISELNFDAYLLFFMSHLPSLILTAEPVTPPCLPHGLRECGEDLTVGPYQSLIQAVQLCTWCVGEVCELLCGEGVGAEQARQIVPLASHSVRVCQAVIGATEFAIVACMRWRNSSSSPHHFEAPDTDSDLPDWASVDFLEEVFLWAALLLHQIHEYASMLTTKIMASESESVPVLFPKGLSRLIPSLKTKVDKMRIKLERWKMETGSVDLQVDCAGMLLGVEEDRDAKWLHPLQHLAESYNQHQQEILKTPISLSAWQVDKVTAVQATNIHMKQQWGEDTFTREHNESFGGLHTQIEVEEKGEKTGGIVRKLRESSNGFGVATSRAHSSSGWGWGEDDSDSSGDNDDNDDGDEEEEVKGHVDLDADDEDDVVIDSEDSYDSESEVDEFA